MNDVVTTLVDRAREGDREAFASLVLSAHLGVPSSGVADFGRLLPKPSALPSGH